MNVQHSRFVSRFMVQDLQSQEKYFFLCNRWLSATKPDCSKYALVSAVGGNELGEYFHLFNTETHADLRNSHMWLFAFYRPPMSQFSRVQRAGTHLCAYACYNAI